MLPSTMIRDNKRKEGKMQEKIWILKTKGDFALYDSENQMTGKKDKRIYDLGRIWPLLQCSESKRGQWRNCCSARKANAYYKKKNNKKKHINERLCL